MPGSRAAALKRAQEAVLRPAGDPPRSTGHSAGHEDGFSLFDAEEAIIGRADVMLARLSEMAEGVQELAGAYRRGTREQRRLVRMSDRMQLDLQRANQRMAEQQRELQALNAALSAEIEHRGRLEAELRRLVDTDHLTGALTRRRFLEIAERAWPRTAGDACLLVLDLDRFKRINDGHGHAAGDAALVAFAATCRGALRAGDAFGRMGGEEFAVLLPETGPAEGLALAEGLRRAVADTPVPTEGGMLAISVSVGLAASAVGEPLTEALKRADEALYGAKDGGRDRVRCAESRGTD
ncbi:GGDEF domain-containing protein [Methylobacterium radiodurans]|uniref:diguanylate cyclase n=1 Tax=Methylobacterium radiodurans TaxID=2202828 RepID=A0A2U8VMR8_9HYPH|nr:GGDEF domain-containing protein [Methylobacterium radiodurans]AWN34887.1 GGDEF domain-containing protein [Methylobacterium radiodurans]